MHSDLPEQLSCRHLVIEHTINHYKNPMTHTIFSYTSGYPQKVKSKTFAMKNKLKNQANYGLRHYISDEYR